jgi:hypothetical protein
LGTRYPTAVLSLISPDGFPFAVRVPLHVDGAARWITIDGAPSGIPFQPGLACLTAEAVVERRSGTLQVRGDLVFVEDTWALVPHQVISGLGADRSPIDLLRSGLRRLRGGQRAHAPVHGPES